ncbi:MAG TPA: glycosyltransferase family 39 protein, partial [Bacillota bacterium]|nr:glycosyltransferase family 39 protein [Bacillota bacterium]
MKKFENEGTNSGVYRLFKFINAFAPPIALFLAALAIRIPWLWEVPRYIDELREVNLAYLIYLKEAFPLHNFAREIGAMHNYILAGIFSVFGPNPLWPRLYVAVTSAATVVLIYYLGKKLYNRWTGLIAAGLLLTNGMHILVTHMAWANCTTPFFFTLALFGTVITEQEKSGKWLIFSALLWAMALQTHSSVLVYLIMAVIYLLRPGFRQETGIQARYYYAAVGVFLLSYANMIVYNLISGFDSIQSILGKHYTLEQHPGILSFGNNFFNMFTELIRSVSSTYYSHPGFWDYLRYPQFIIALCLLGLGIYRTIKMKKSLPVWMITGGFLMIPWINHRYNFYIVTRYIMPIIICAILLVAYATADILKTICSKAKHHSRVIIPATVAFGIIMVLQWIPFRQYCSGVTHTDFSNRISLEVLQTVKTYARQSKTIIWLDKELTVKDEPFPLLFRLSNLQFIPLHTNLLLTQKLDWRKLMNDKP